MPELVYIAGYGRSGSTILDILLGNHPLIFGGGELTNCFTEWAGPNRCSCGEIYSDCQFWQQVLARSGNASLAQDFGPAYRLTRQIEARSIRPSWVRHTSPAQAYGALWRALFEAIGRTSGASMIVDSSKSTARCARRSQALAELCGLDVRLVHLVRDPRAIMWSVQRGSNRKLEAGQSGAGSGGSTRALLSWMVVNLSVHRAIERNPELNALQVRYEDLVAHPGPTLENLGRFLNVNMKPVIDRVGSQDTLDPGHGVSGNRMRRRGTLRLVADREWERALPASSKRLARLSWPLARRYGYDV